MKHRDLVKNPIFKIVGICLILYFALFSNKHDNRSLSRRYSPDNIKESVGKAVKQKKEIERKLNEAKALKAKLRLEKSRNNQLKDKNEK